MYSGVVSANTCVTVCVIACFYLWLCPACTYMTRENILSRYVAKHVCMYLTDMLGGPDAFDFGHASVFYAPCA